MATRFGGSSASRSSGGHTHGTIKHNSKMRCGINEGISVLRKNSDKVGCLFTDGLDTCVQVVILNQKAAFTCHLAEGNHLTFWIKWAKNEFVKSYGSIDACHLITNVGSRSVNDALAGLDGITISSSKTKWFGAAVDLDTGAISLIPKINVWYAGQADVIGYLTARELIDIHFTGRRTIGSTGIGDAWDEQCATCKSTDFSKWEAPRSDSDSENERYNEEEYRW
jgi:hypothetical protein